MSMCDRGPPPCQYADCDALATAGSGYVYCSKHSDMNIHNE